MQSANKIAKTEIRKKVNSILSNKERIEIKNKSGLVLKNLISTDLWNNADIVFTYLSINNEVETAGMVKCAIINGKKVAVPRIVGKRLVFFLVSGHITFNSVRNEAPDPYHEKHFEFNKFNILEPKIHLPKIYFENLKNYKILFIVPGLAFTKTKNRLGKGGGFYDRTIKELQEQKLKSLNTIGVFFEDQFVADLPLDPWDKKLDYIVTEEKIY